MKQSYWSIGILLLACACTFAVLTRIDQSRPTLPQRSDLRMYLIMPDRFDDAEPRNNDYNGPHDTRNPLAVQGGDLKGIERRLGYLSALGVNAIWLTPVQKNVAGAFHGYWIQDFLRVDPRLGTMEDLRRLIRKAHRLGMRVYLDVVCNHTGPLSEPVGGAWAWNDAGYTLAWRDSSRLPMPASLQDLSLYHNFGEVKQWADPWQILGELPGGLDDLKTEDPRVLNIMIRIWRWWMEQSGCDGYRVDTVKHVDMDFWYHFLAAMRLHAQRLGKRDFFIFGEVYSGEDRICAPYTQPDSSGRRGFDAVFNFSLAEALRDVFAGGQPVRRLAESLINLSLYHATARPHLITFIDNHDLPRFLHVAGGRIESLRQALTYLYFSEGIPILYYGTEQNFRGGTPDYENRESMFSGGWKGLNPQKDAFDSSAATFGYIRSLMDMRAAHAVLRKGGTAIALIDTLRNVIAVQREYRQERAFAVINRGVAVARIEVSSPHALRSWPDGRVYHPDHRHNVRLSCDAGAITLFLPR